MYLIFDVDMVVCIHWLCCVGVCRCYCNVVLVVVVNLMYVEQRVLEDATLRNATFKLELY